MRLKILVSKKICFLLKLIFIAIFLMLLFCEFFLTDKFSFESYNCFENDLSEIQINKKKLNLNEDSSDNSNNLIKECKNEITFNNKIAIWTLITEDTLKYAIGAVKLLKSIKNNVNTAKFDAIILELVEKPFESRVKQLFLKAGWKICVVERIAPLLIKEKQTIERFRDQFTKLVLWNIDEYKANYYFDADTLVVKNIDNFLNLYKKLDEPNHSFRIGCAQDFREKWVESFNMGVFFVKPDKKEFQRLISLKNDLNFKYEIVMSEQGFLNEVYKYQWFDIGFKYNANAAVYSYMKEFWQRNENEISIIHFTTSKPWECMWKYRHLCSRWQMLNHC